MMQDRTPTRRTVRLEVEQLESRTVLTSFTGTLGWSIAAADVVSDSFGVEYITGNGPGAPGLVQVWDSTKGNLLSAFYPFGRNYRGGVYVATGNIDGDPGQIKELIVSTAGNTVGRVKVYSFSSGGLQQLAVLTPFGPTYTGGVQIASANVTGGPEAELIVGRERGRSTVQVYAFDPLVTTFNLIRQFNAYGSLNTGVTLAAANIHTTKNSKTDPYDYNYAEVITGRAVGLPQIRVFDVQTPAVRMLASYMAFDPNNPANLQGIHLAAGSTDAQRGAEIYVALRNSGTIRVFRGQTGTLIGQIRSVFPYTVFPPGYTRAVNFAIATTDDDFNDIYNTADLVVVAADSRLNQFPIAFFGQKGSPAGFNGFRRLP
jgi:WD40 repeat protein